MKGGVLMFIGNDHRVVRGNRLSDFEPLLQ